MLDIHIICSATTGNKRFSPCFIDQEGEVQKDERSHPVAGLGWKPKSAQIPTHVPKPHVLCQLRSYTKSYCSSM